MRSARSVEKAYTAMATIRMCTVHWKKFLMLLSCLLLFAACAHAELPSPAATPPPQSTALSPTPLPSIALQQSAEQISAQLSDVASLTSAVEQLATALGVATARIGIRIRSKDCTVCNLAENGAQAQPPLLTLTEAEATLNAYDLLWLVAEPLSCSYYFDGKTMAPRGCQIAAP